ncbi:MAG: hypothetical protein ACYDCL_22965, partial [Myxococcales bacterium]
PWAYLRDLFCLIPSWPKSGVLDLAPAYWRATNDKPEVLARLAANLYRHVTLGALEPQTHKR